MSIASEITRLQGAKSDLKTAIEAKGVTVPSSTTIDGYATLVGQIQTGGGGISLTGYTEGAVVSIQPTVQVSSPSYTIPNPLSVTPKVIVGVMKGDISGRSGCSGPFMVALTQCTGQTSPQQAIMGAINSGNISPGGTVSVTVNANDTLTISLNYYDHPNYGWDVIILG